MIQKLSTYIILGYLISLFYGCHNSNPYECTINEQVIARNDSIMGLKNYKGSLPEIWKKLNESELESLENKVYRLTISHSFDKKVWTYKIEKTAKGGLLTINKTYQKAYSLKHNINDTTIVKPITMKDWNRIDNEFYKNCFWTLPVSIDDLGCDGSTYLLEANDPNAENPTSKKYFIVSRWQPEENTPFRFICNVIVDLDNIE